MARFKGQHIIITGASSGMGEATARLIAEQGACVSLLARREERLEEIASDIANHGGKALGFACDVSDQTKLIQALDQALTAHGPCDGLFLNAGSGGSFASIGDYTDDTFEQVMTTNLYGPFWALRHMMPKFLERKKAAVVLTGSLASERGMANNVAYVASKHAVLGLSRAAALEGAAHGVRVNCLIPGFINTPMMSELPDEAKAHLAGIVPQGEIGTSLNMAHAAAFLLSDDAAHITAQALSVDGGMLGTLKV